jgi:hypothetical protein
MPFLLWLAQPQTPVQNVRDAISALSPEVEFTWSFNEIRPFVTQLPEPRKTQAQCLIAFFETHRDGKALDGCLSGIGDQESGIRDQGSGGNTNDVQVSFSVLFTAHRAELSRANAAGFAPGRSGFS